MIPKGANRQVQKGLRRSESGLCVALPFVRALMSGSRCFEGWDGEFSGVGGLVIRDEANCRGAPGAEFLITSAEF